MSPLEGVKILSTTEDVVEMKTGLVPLKNVTEHAREVSAIKSCKIVLKFM